MDCFICCTISAVCCACYCVISDECANSFTGWSVPSTDNRLIGSDIRIFSTYYSSYFASCSSFFANQYRIFAYCAVLRTDRCILCSS